MKAEFRGGRRKNHDLKKNRGVGSSSMSDGTKVVTGGPKGEAIRLNPQTEGEKDRDTQNEVPGPRNMWNLETLEAKRKRK